MDINNIQKLVHLIHSINPKNDIAEKVGTNSKYSTFYKYLLINRTISEEEIKSILYKEYGQSFQFRTIKHRFINKCIDIVISNNLPVKYLKSDYQDHYQKLLKNVVFCKKLHDIGLRDVVINLEERLLKIAIRYDITEICFMLLKDLNFHYGLIRYNKNKFEKYKKLFEYYTDQLFIHNKVYSIYIELGNKISQTKSKLYTNEIFKVEKRLIELETYIENKDSYYLKFYLYSAFYYLYLIKSDIKLQLFVTTKALIYFNDKKQFKKTAVFAFTQKRGLSLLGLKKYSNALFDFNECLNLLSKTNLFEKQYTYSYIFLTHILQQDYQKAYEVLCTVLNNSELKKLDVTFTEPWYIKEAFIHFLIKTGKVKPEESPQHTLRSFRLSRFMNEVNLFSKDKRGLNITINILQMLFLIIEEQYDKFLDRLNSLKQYDYKYLKQEEFIRSSSFIKMLQKIPSGKYNADEIRQKAAKYHQRLLDNPMDFSEKSLNIEIIPYERLWEEVVCLFETTSSIEV